MKVLGSIGEDLQIIIRKTDDSILNDVNWDDIVWSQVKEIGLKSKNHIVGFHKNLGCITWYPRQPYTYDKPLFYIYQKAWGKINDNWHKFYITTTDTVRTPYHQTNDNIAPDERKMGWTGTIDYGGNDFDVDVAVLAEPLGLPQALKTKITTPIDLQNIGIEYQFYLNPDFASDAQKNIKWVRVYTTYEPGAPGEEGTFVYTDYDITKLMEITSIPSLDAYIFNFYNDDKSKLLCHFEFDSIFRNSNNRFVKIEEVTLPNSETTYCLRIGATFGAISSGETLSIDPWFGDQTEGGTSNHIDSRTQGLYASTAGDGGGNIESISIYAYYWTDSGGEFDSRCALFDSSKNLIQETGDVHKGNNTAETTEWVTHTFASPVAVTASTEYLLGATSDAGGTHDHISVFYASDGLSIQYNATCTSPPAFDDPMGGDKYAGYVRGMYATYAADAGPTPSEAYIKTSVY